MNSIAYEELFELLIGSELAHEEQELVLAAAEGPSSLGALIDGGTTPSTPESDADELTERQTPLAFLEEIAVEGFRGVGPRARLQLQPGPGLTLVVGRNGSGKSSFAEALEVLLTGTTWRWQERAKVWREGWRNLHHDGTATVSARVRIDGTTQPVQLTRSWPSGSHLDSVTETTVSGAASTWSELDWDRALEQFRPILSYNEVGTMFSSKAAALYDALSAILGLEEFDAVLATLREERLSREKTAKQERAARTELSKRLEASDDPRSAEVAALLKQRTPSLDAVVAHLTMPEDARPDQAFRAFVALELPTLDEINAAVAEVIRGRDAVRELRQTDVGQIDALASLLEAGLRYHEHADSATFTDCPLCGVSGTIDAGWSMRTDAAAQELRNRSRDLRVAEGEVGRAEASLRRTFDQAIPVAPGRVLAAPDPSLDVVPASAAWDAWSQALAELRPDTDLQPVYELGFELLDALTTLRATAEALVEVQASTRRPPVEAIAAWVDLARRAARDRAIVERLKRAEAWMNTALAELRKTRLAPIVDGARANWDLLRHESNVTLGDVGLRKQGNLRYAAFDVTVDGSDASALGVMSQGELCALAISIFLPRAMLESSPFGFVVIDDPVQSMDPAKVDGLARVLAGAATNRQVVVFTHDERLPEAIRRLGIDPRVMRVQRRAKSKLEIVAGRPPSERYLSEASALSRGEHLPPQIITRVIPGFCRSAIEAACEERIRRERVAQGLTHAEVDRQLAEMTTLMSWLSAAFGLAQAQGNEVRQKVTNVAGPGALKAVNLARAGAHDAIVGLDPGELVRDTRRLVQALERP